MYHLGKTTALFSLAFILASATTVTRADHDDDDNNGFVACGSVITQSVKLSGDLTCPEHGLIIGADDVRLDLNGHTIMGTGTEEEGEFHGVESHGHENMTIQNGTITGFFNAIYLFEVEDVLLTDLVLTGLQEDAVQILFGENVRFQNSSILGSEEPDTTSAIWLESVQKFHIHNLDIKNHSNGVAYFAHDDMPPTNGVISNTYFEGAEVAVGIGRTTRAIITGNHFARNIVAISSGSDCCLPQTKAGVVITGNFVHDNSERGIQVFNTSGAVIARNQVHHNGGCGVSLADSPFGPGSTHNKILFNKTFDNGTDMCHDETSINNLYFGNSCVTSIGAELVGKCPN